MSLYCLNISTFFCLVHAIKMFCKRIIVIKLLSFKFMTSSSCVANRFGTLKTPLASPPPLTVTKEKRQKKNKKRRFITSYPCNSKE